MQIGEYEENQNTKYNHVAPIDLNTIPNPEKEQALKEFAEGSLGLEKCLRVMWDNNLKTHACCAGEHDDYTIAYIAMSEGIDIFSFLSEELLSNDMIALKFEKIENRQTLYFGGTKELKDKLMEKVANDILTGRKQNNAIVQNKIGKELNSEWSKEGRIYHMKKIGMSEEEIKYHEELEKILKTGTVDEMIAIISEIKKLNNQRLAEKKEKRR